MVINGNRALTRVRGGGPVAESGSGRNGMGSSRHGVAAAAFVVLFLHAGATLSGQPRCSGDWVPGWEAAFEAAAEALQAERGVRDRDQGHVEALEAVSSVAYDFRGLRSEHDLPEAIDRSAAEMEILLHGYALGQFVFHHVERETALRAAILEVGIKLLSGFGRASDVFQEWRRTCG